MFRIGTIFTYSGTHVLLGWGKRYWLSAPSNDFPYSFYFPDFFLSHPAPWFTHEYTVILSLEDCLELFPKISPIDMRWSLPQKDLFESMYRDLQQHFSTHALQKGVPYTSMTSEQKLSEEKIFSSLSSGLQYLQENQGYIYGFWNDEEGILGITPELLFSYIHNEGILQTVACAGTREASVSDVTMLADPTLLKEHHTVIKGIQESFDSKEKLRISFTKVCRYGKLKHLMTDIQIILQNPVPVDQLISRLHPTPALGVYPQNIGKKWLLHLDSILPRGRYGAPIGYYDRDNNSTHCYVAIRNIQWKNSLSCIFAGCGVIPTSQFEKEWEEVQLKLETIRYMLSL